MRRNLRLDWRALALLGALLSIIIDWPGLVYAMPTILPPVAAITAEAAPTDTLNIIKNDKILNFFPPAVAEEEHRTQQKDDSKMKSEFNNNQMLNENLKSFSTTATAETATETQQQPLSQQQRLTTINEKQQVNENNNSISVKELNDNEKQKQQEKITAIHKTTTTQQLQKQQQQNSQDESAAVQKVSLLKNTHTKNSTIKTISLTKSTTTTSPTSSTTTPTPPTISTTESSAKIQSTLMPSILADQSDEDVNEQQNPNSSHLNTDNLINNFKFSSSHHLAILSRTERSIRSSSSSATSANVSSLSGSGSSSRGSGGVLVRRSSDMSVLKTKRLNNSRNLHHKNNLDRNERSTVSHLSGPSRKIQLYIKNRFIQLLPDGTVNGTQDEQCDYTILQRSTVEVGRIKIQGVATCLYLCMDPCGAVYGSKEFTDDCVFNESMEQHNYNTYSSTYNSNTRRKYYLALNRHGEPRKLQIPPSRSLGKLATYTNAIPETVPQERVEQLIAKTFGANRVKHGIRQLCDTGKPLIELIDSKNFKARPKCNPNNSNNNSNSKNTLSRNLDKENTLVNHNQQQHQQNQLNNNGQVLNNVPVANDKNNLSSNSRSSSSSNSRSETNRDSSSSSPSSISISQNNGHISNSNSHSKPTSSNSHHSDSLITSSISNSTAPQTGSHRGGKKAGKKRKCRRFENEEQHNCTTPLNRPTSITRRGNQLGPIRQQKCRDLLLQQQQAGVTDIVLPPMCTKKGGPKKQQQGNNRRGQGKNGLGTDGLGPNNRRGKKLNMNRGGGGGGGPGRQAAKNNQNNGNNNGGSKKKQKNSKRGGVINPNNNNNKKNNNKKASGSTTEKTASTSTSTLKPKFWETTSLMPSTTLFENYDPHAETTSDRGDREQRNVRYSNSMEEYMEQSSEDTSAAEDPEDDDNDMETNDEMNEDASYEDDSYAVPSSSHIPYAAPESSHTPLTAGADDFLYYDQLDFLPMGLWEFIAVIWILAWSLQTLS
ncbi:putative uncharacterized protein DDB_G0286901 isoform X2 [Lucilia cuprina]|uniref:putative uncharacterized protein DDB_G0286901 isoform X2 n=1 Tax=Lucilia cuprina TaxID=7375 RepID=UPI001F0565C0|nr:putative uncharacterized protein DDB_G0286901 isoform X2 [Lucilia cuprina]